MESWWPSQKSQNDPLYGVKNLHLPTSPAGRWPLGAIQYACSLYWRPFSSFDTIFMNSPNLFLAKCLFCFPLCPTSYISRPLLFQSSTSNQAVITFFHSSVQSLMPLVPERAGLPSSWMWTWHFYYFVCSEEVSLEDIIWVCSLKLDFKKPCMNSAPFLSTLRGTDPHVSQAIFLLTHSYSGHRYVSPTFLILVLKASNISRLLLSLLSIVRGNNKNMTMFIKNK